MFEKFGEFDSVEELNAAAAGQKEQGDREALIELAEENGIDREDAEDYFDGNLGELANPLMAACGKLEVEAKDLKACEIMEDWISYIRAVCMKDEKTARAVRRKTKSLSGCVAEILKWSFAHQYNIDRKIMEEAGVSAQRCTLGIPGSARVKRIIRDYYAEG